MKSILVKLFWFILAPFEKGGDDDFVYKPLNRTILIVVGCLFSFLSLASGFVSLRGGNLQALFPVVVFFAAGLVCLVVGLLGSERAVSKIWGSGKPTRR